MINVLVSDTRGSVGKVLHFLLRSFSENESNLFKPHIPLSQDSPMKRFLILC